MTACPSAASRRAIAAPMPEVEPVTRATRRSAGVGMGGCRQRGRAGGGDRLADLARRRIDGDDLGAERGAGGLAMGVEAPETLLVGHPVGPRLSGPCPSTKARRPGKQ